MLGSSQISLKERSRIFPSKNLSFPIDKHPRIFPFEVIPKVDILYMTRIQQERFSDPLEFERVKNAYILKNKMLDGAKKNLRVLHPLPRINEITEDVDSNPKAYYFQQAKNGIYVRQALLTTILGKSIKN